MSRKLAAYNCMSSLVLSTTLEYELVDANRVCQGIQKVRVAPATRSAVATWLIAKRSEATNLDNGSPILS